MSQFQIGQRVQACDPFFARFLEKYGYSLTGTVVDVVNEHRWPVKVLMDKSDYEPIIYSKDKQVIPYHISFKENGAERFDEPVIEVIE